MDDRRPIKTNMNFIERFRNIMDVKRYTALTDLIQSSWPRGKALDFWVLFSLFLCLERLSSRVIHVPTTSFRNLI